MHIDAYEHISAKLQSFSRRELIHKPTPFRRLESLSDFLAGPRIYIKREDLTGLAFGGNKSRKLEYIMADVLEKGADAVLTWASVQSNWCLQTAAAARKFGIKPVLLLFKTNDAPVEYDGNLLLDFLLDADVHIHEAEKGKVVSKDDAEQILEDLKFQIGERGYKPYTAPIGGSMVGGSMLKPLGALSYVDAFTEMYRQAEESGVMFDHVILASGSGSTQAGLIIGAKALSPGVKILGVSVSEKKEIYREIVYRIAEDTRQALDLDIDLDKEDVKVLDEYIKDGYGIINSEVSRAVRMVAEKEGIFLDPVYTGKAMVALLDLIEKKYFPPDSSVVFMHTGGTAALFPYKQQLVRFLSE